MADLPIIEILGGVIVVFFGAIITLLIHFDKSRRKDMTRLRKEVKKEINKLEGATNAGFSQVNQRIDSLYLHLVPQPTPGVVRALPEPPATPPEPELRTGTD
ncbi:MAG: hypothetical protein F4Y75_02795 [Acidimicrobiia bacterium]|nr:hypothetical protein [bacterium]MCY3579436.1 hypothetical protein [bacterium]MDE0642617.1 hypothetical protein [bacterium]MXZ06434.1 hypothetical protein [Acidimicrobiia bacterium]MYD05258.1 hypothetical protein [Acidimicrobiia bacterium]